MAYGDEIRIERGPMRPLRVLGGDFKSRGLAHYGIDVGGGEVVHYRASPTGGKRASAVRQDPLNVFRYGLRAAPKEGKPDLTRLEYKGPPPGVSRHEVVGRALGLVGTGRYHAALHNCEHFAGACRVGGKVVPGQTSRIAGSRVLAPAAALLLANPVTRRMVIRASKKAGREAEIWRQAQARARSVTGLEYTT